MRFRVNDGQQVQRGPATYAAGEEFEATGDEAKMWQASDLVRRVGEPKKRDEK